MVNNKAEIISKIYNDLSGFGSIQQTFAEARKIDKTITLNDVKSWKENNIVRKKNLPGYSYVASTPRFEYQVVPFYVNLGEQKQKVRNASRRYLHEAGGSSADDVKG